MCFFRLLIYFIFLYEFGEGFSALLVHKWFPGSKNAKKLVHLCLQGVALGCGVFGIWTKFHGERGVVANFYSLHSWMGLMCMSLFAAQVLFFFLFSPIFNSIELSLTFLRNFS